MRHCFGAGNACWCSSPFVVVVLVVLNLLPPNPAHACSTVFDPLVNLEPDAATLIGTIVAYVSVDPAGTRWIDRDGDGEVWGWLVKVDEAVWNPFGQLVFEVYPFDHQADCGQVGFGRERVEAQHPGTRIWLWGRALPGLPTDAAGGTRLSAIDGTWGVLDSEADVALAGPFDFKTYFEGSFRTPRFSPGVAIYAYHRVLGELGSTADADDRIASLRRVQPFLFRSRYEELLATYEPDASVRASLMAEYDADALVKLYGRLRDSVTLQQDGGIGHVDVSASGILFDDELVQLPVPVNALLRILGPPTRDEWSNAGVRWLDWDQHAIYAEAEFSSPESVHRLRFLLALSRYGRQPERSFEGVLSIGGEDLSFVLPEANDRWFADQEALVGMGFSTPEERWRAALGTNRVELSWVWGNGGFSRVVISTSIGEEDRRLARQRRRARYEDR